MVLQAGESGGGSECLADRHCMNLLHCSYLEEGVGIVGKDFDFLYSVLMFCLFIQLWLGLASLHCGSLLLLLCLGCSCVVALAVSGGGV